MKRYYWKKGGARINDIGVPGARGFGVGVCPPDLLSLYNSSNDPIFPLPGYNDPFSDNYGNYRVSLDGSIMVWCPFGWGKKNADNTGTIKPEWYFADETAANAAGYFLPRVFINGGAVQRGIFIDKYKLSLTGITASELDSSGSLANKGIASSIKWGNPISSSADTLRKLVTGSDNLYAGSFANCRYNSKSPSNNMAGAIDVVKTRGASYHAILAFAAEWLRFISMVHSQASVGTSLCAWNDITPAEPRGNNNYGADYYDSAVIYQSCDDGYWGTRTPPMEARKSGGGIPFNKTTHNGQNCGICIDANQWEFLLGVSSIAETAQNIASITRESQAVITITNAGATNANYANGKPLMITGTSTAEWNTKFQNKIFTISDLSGNTFKVKDKTGEYIDTSALTADYVADGFQSTTGKFYILKESVDVKTITSGNTGATDHWGTTGLAAMFDEVDIDMCGSFAVKLGNGTNQVFSGETNRSLAAYKLSQTGICMNKDSYGSGTNTFGNDYFYIYVRSDVALLGFGLWSTTNYAGPGARYWLSSRTYYNRYTSVRGGLFIG